MSNSPIFYVMGVCGCGKSTIGKLLSKEFNIPFFDGDDYHPKVNVAKMVAGNPLNDADREGWLKRLNELSKANQAKGAVIACSALKESYRSILKNGLEQSTFVYLEGTNHQLSERLAQRKDHFMPPGLLQSQLETLEVPLYAIHVSIMSLPSEMVSSIMSQYKKQKPQLK